MREIYDVKQVETICRALNRSDNLVDALKDIRSVSIFKYININKGTIIKIGKMMRQGKNPEEITSELSQENNNKQLEIAKLNNHHLFISDYTVVSGEGLDDFLKKVRSSMKVGWIPYGGISNIQGEKSISANDLFFQAMVKFKY